MKKSSAWGHQIGPLEKFYRLGHPETPAVMHCSNGLRCPGVHEEEYTWEGWDKQPRTGTHRLGSVAIYRASYLYISGRKGYTSQRDLSLCQPCGEKFAKRYGLTLPEAVAP